VGTAGVALCSLVFRRRNRFPRIPKQRCARWTFLLRLRARNVPWADLTVVPPEDPSHCVDTEAGGGNVHRPTDFRAAGVQDCRRRSAACRTTLAARQGGRGYLPHPIRVPNVREHRALAPPPTVPRCGPASSRDGRRDPPRTRDGRESPRSEDERTPPSRVSVVDEGDGQFRLCLRRPQ